MTTVNNRYAVAKIRLGAGGLTLMVLGAIFFMLATNWDNQADRVAWTWMLIAFGIAGVLGSALIGRQSRLVCAALWVGIVATYASIIVLKVLLTVTA